MGKQLQVTLVLAKFPGKSSRPEVFCEKGVPKNFTKFTGKHQCLFFSNVLRLQGKKGTPSQLFEF